MNTDQIKNSFDYVSLQKMGRGVAIAGGAAALIYFLQWITTIDFGQFTLAVGAIASIIINVIREYRSGYTPDNEIDTGVDVSRR